MGWQDRPYSSAPQNNRFGGNFDWRQLIFGSVSIGHWFGIHVRVHSSLLWLCAFRILFAGSRGGGLSMKDALVSTLLLFVIILLHEFGHCFAARGVGGDAREILLWPLGGLAFVNPPRRPLPSFITSAGGPLVNVLICVVTGAILMALSHGQFSLPFNPLIPFGGRIEFNDTSFQLISGGLGYYVWWVYITSWTLLFFNLLPIFPLDGGRMLQEILWPKFGYYDSMNFACVVGMAGAVLMGLLGLASFNTMLLVLAYAGYMTCYQTRMSLREHADAAWEETRYDTPRASTRRANVPRARSAKSARPRDDKFSIRDLNPFERIARARRKKQFERLMKDD